MGAATKRLKWLEVEGLKKDRLWHGPNKVSSNARRLMPPVGNGNKGHATLRAVQQLWGLLSAGDWREPELSVPLYSGVNAMQKLPPLATLSISSAN